MLAEKISGAGDRGDPDGRTQKVENRKGSPAHAQHSGQRSGEDSQTEDEAGKEYGGRTVAGEYFLAALQRGGGNPKEALIAIEQGTSSIVADGVTQVVAKSSGTGSDHDDPSQMEPMFGIGEKTCQQKRSLTGYGDTGVLAKERQRYPPITVGDNEFAKRVRDRVMHELMKRVLSSQKSVVESWSGSLSASEKIDERAVEVLGRFFVGQVADAF